ncbi:MAG: hypothetical protein RIR79_2285 [Pseudomonadota bacterium]|jgi:hypothetical protein
MNLRINPTRQGTQWVKLGFKTFFRQPLALSGLFFMFLALMSVLNSIPYIGSVVALVLLPAITLGLMVATQETQNGKFPMPIILFSAFRAGKEKLHAMLVLGGIYTVGFLLVIGVCTLIDDGQFADIYLLGGSLNAEVMDDPDFQSAMLVATVLYLPLSMMFWHAPALVYWHGISPVKSLFFSFFSCLRNWKAFALYGVTWTGVFLALAVVIALLASLLGSASLLAIMTLAATLLLAAAFFTSIYFSFIDSFVMKAGDDRAA